MKYITKMEIDLKKLKNNTKKLCKSYNDYNYKFVDLKDNGHGLGFKVLNTISKNGINYAFVGSMKDALEIRKFNKDVKVLVNYFITDDEVYDAINNNIAITIYKKEDLDELLTLDLKDTLNVHILVDNGSNLMGIKTKEELEEVINIINGLKNVNIEGLYTEITTNGITDEFYYKEMDNFYTIIKDCIKEEYIIHANEPIMYHKKKTFINGIKFDLSLVGIEDNVSEDFITKMHINEISKKYQDLEFPNIDLELIFSITSEIMAKRLVKKGTAIGRNYVAKKDMYVGVVPIGHKDGITRAINYVGVNNYKRNILTDNIDQLIIEIDDSVSIKDKVYILNEEREIYDFLSSVKTNRYYLMSILNHNLTKTYINEEDNGDNYL